MSRDFYKTLNVNYSVKSLYLYAIFAILFFVIALSVYLLLGDKKSDKVVKQAPIARGSVMVKDDSSTVERDNKKDSADKIAPPDGYVAVSFSNNDFSSPITDIAFVNFANGISRFLSDNSDEFSYLNIIIKNNSAYYLAKNNNDDTMAIYVSPRAGFKINPVYGARKITDLQEDRIPHKMDFSRDGQFFVLKVGNKTILYNVKTNEKKQLKDVFDFLFNGDRLVLLKKDGVYDMDPGNLKEEKIWSASPGRQSYLRLSFDGNNLLFYDSKYDKYLVLTFQKGELKDKYTITLDFTPKSVNISPNGEYLLLLRELDNSLSLQVLRNKDLKQLDLRALSKLPRMYENLSFLQWFK